MNTPATHRHPLPTTFLRSSALMGAILSGTAMSQSGGPMAAIGQGYSLDTATAATIPGITAASVVQSATDFDAAYPTVFVPPPGVANFATLPIPAGLDVDALSIGLDWVVSNGAGTATVPPGQWAAITYTVSPLTAGVPSTVVATEVANPDGAQGDVFSYILPGSSLPITIVGIPQRARDSTEISVFTPPAGRGNLDAHDLFIGLIYRDNPQYAATLPPPTCYFSVTDGTATAIPAAWGAAGLRSGATIYSTTWDPTANGGVGGWDPVVVAYTPATFGLTAQDDIDALALDLVRGEVLFSVDPFVTPGLPTLMWSVLGSGAWSEYRLPGAGGSVSIALGVGPAPDDLDGVCALDPGDPVNQHPARMDRMVGTWRQPILPSAFNNLQAGVTRTYDPVTSQHILVSMMTGWPPPFTPLNGVAACAITIGPPTAGPYVTLGLTFRPDPASPYFQFEGHPERCEWAIPPGWENTDIPLTFAWAAASNVGFALSHPVTVNL
ncbi:MAG: hypothetical protein NXI31_15485 [bacterium]|nr:hypothetical protein [bacterium]